jgi:hypothetical protein
MGDDRCPKEIMTYKLTRLRVGGTPRRYKEGDFEVSKRIRMIYL